MSMRYSICLVMLLGSSALASDTEGWINMFNGKNLEGWTAKNGSTRFDSRNGFISGSPAKEGGVSYLCTVGEFGDFELEMEVKVDSRFGEAFTSAVQIRSQAKTDGDNSTFNPGPVHGPQIKLASTTDDGGESGRIFMNSKNGKTAPLTDCEPHDIFQNRQWNLLRIVAVGPRIQTFLNEKKIDDVTAPDLFKTYSRGFIALQVRPRPDETARPLVMWRNLRIKPVE